MARNFQVQRSKLLLDDYPLIVLPALAVAIGVSEAMLLQQINFLLYSLEGKEIGGRKWIHMTDAEWVDQFPFWSQNTLRRLLDKLEKAGLILSGVFNNLPLDRTQWYTIDYDAVDKLEGKRKERKKRNDLPNFGNSMKTKRRSSKLRKIAERDSDLPKLGRAIPETPKESEITTTSRQASPVESDSDSRGEVIEKEIDELPANPLLQKAEESEATERPSTFTSPESSSEMNAAAAAPPPKPTPGAMLESWLRPLSAIVPDDFAYAPYMRQMKRLLTNGVLPPDMEQAGELFWAWYVAAGKPGIVWETGAISLVIRTTRELAKRGITPADIRRTVREAKQDSFWQDKPVSLKYVTQVVKHVAEAPHRPFEAPKAIFTDDTKIARTRGRI